MSQIRFVMRTDSEGTRFSPAVLNGLVGKTLELRVEGNPVSDARVTEVTVAPDGLSALLCLELSDA